MSDTECHSTNICQIHECLLIGLMSDIGLKLLEEPSETARASVERDDDVTGDMPTDRKCLSHPRTPHGPDMLPVSVT